MPGLIPAESSLSSESIQTPVTATPTISENFPITPDEMTFHRYPEPMHQSTPPALVYGSIPPLNLPTPTASQLAPRKIIPNWKSPANRSWPKAVSLPAGPHLYAAASAARATATPFSNTPFERSSSVKAPSIKATCIKAPSIGPSSLPESRIKIAVAALPYTTKHHLTGTTFARFERVTAGNITEPDITSYLDKTRSFRYFQSYFEHAEPIYQLWPVAKIAAERHEAIWQDGGPHFPPGSKTTLMALLALGAFFEGNLLEAENLHRLARNSYLDICELATVDSVQLALQMAVFQMNTNRSKALWSSLATAVRLAQALNLHRKASLEGLLASEQLRRRRLWDVALVQDVWLSFTTGRPSLISERGSDHDPTWCLSANTPSSRSMSDTIFGMQVRLSYIWMKVHEALYRRPNEGSEVSWLETLPVLELDFSAWSSEFQRELAGARLCISEVKQYHNVLVAQALMREYLSLFKAKHWLKGTAY